MSNVSDTMIGKPISSAPTIHLAQSARFAKSLANWLLLLLMVSIIAMMLLPWQQTSRGSGQVIAYVPQERQQTLESPAKGIVARIGKDLADGSVVKKGQFIAEIEPFSKDMVNQLIEQKNDKLKELRSAENQVEIYKRNIRDLESARDLAVEAAQLMVESTQEKLQSKISLRPGYREKVNQAESNLIRQLGLQQKGIQTEKEIEILKMKKELAVSQKNSLEDEIRQVEKEVQSKERSLLKEQKLAEAKVATAQSYVQDALAKQAKINKEIRDIEIKLGETQRLVIEAPRDGIILRMPMNELGKTVKLGDPILTLVPESSQTAVELYVNGNDMPLVQVGQEVRLQFEGYPALQFPAWPSVAVGTFSGEVVVVDATSNDKGQFRILVMPSAEQDWPGPRFLRQGVRVNGWVMLKSVKLGYEIWRQLNGFPVLVSEEKPKKDVKTPKLPK